ncbi:MAG TPA: alpha-amylase family glycosyl hydrolase, partial [Ardenticatenaceae bacterium]|nr:alpha-amylase family glycosyl hydrolase [Ardenticatenaceae bacterium]
KDELLRDDPPNPRYKPGDDPFEQVVHIYSLQRPEVHDVLREMRAVLDSYSERVMVGESFHLADELAFIEYYGENGAECHLPFNFRLILMPWKVEAIRGFVERYEAALPAGAWPNWVLGNHDGSRLATRVGLAQARVAQMLLLTLRGTPTCYYGDEIGMTDVCIHPGRVQDPFERLVPGQGRDPARTPMQWDSSPNAGFSRAEPWLPLAGNYREVNVAVEDGDPSSMLALFRHLTHLRRTTPALTVGSYVSVETQHSGVYAYLRQHERERVLVVLNLRSQSCMLDLSDFGAHCQLVLSTRLDRAGEEALGALQLRPDEGIIARLEG